MTQLEGPLLGQGDVALAILGQLGPWFGDVAAVEQYGRDVPALPTFVAREVGTAVGFLSIKQHFEHAAEVFVLGVVPERCRQGLGRLLLEAAEVWLVGEGVRWLQVKTLGPSEPDPGYERTRQFYLAQGFSPLEEFSTLWDEDNPALLMVKQLGDPAR